MAQNSRHSIFGAAYAGDSAGSGTSAATVYAATTEGLWITANAGTIWRRLTPPDWVINAVVALPGRIVIGTEKLGVLISDDGGAHFRASNAGFYHREIVALALDRETLDACWRY